MSNRAISSHRRKEAVRFFKGLFITIAGAFILAMVIAIVGETLSDPMAVAPAGCSLVTDVHRVQYGETVWEIAKSLREEYPEMQRLSTKDISRSISKCNPGLHTDYIDPGIPLHVPIWCKKGEEASFPYRGEMKLYWE